MNMPTKRLAGRILLYLAVLIVMLIVLFPFYWMAISGFKSPDALFQTPPMLVPIPWSTEFYQRVLKAQSFFRLALNSLIVALSATGLSVFFATLGAYSITRFRYLGRDLVAQLVLFVYMFPAILLVIPLFFIFRSLHLVDTYLGLILAETTFALPFCLWLLIAFFRTIPEEIESAALVDGCERLNVLWRIVVPLAAPGLAAAAVFSFISAWNDYLFPLVLINSDSLKTLPLGVANYVTAESTHWGEAMAAATVLSLPVVIFASLVQKNLVSGLTAGAVKG